MNPFLFLFDPEYREYVFLLRRWRKVKGNHQQEFIDLFLKKIAPIAPEREDEFTAFINEFASNCLCFYEFPANKPDITTANEIKWIKANISFHKNFGAATSNFISAFTMGYQEFLKYHHPNEVPKDLFLTISDDQDALLRESLEAGFLSDLLEPFYKYSEVSYGDVDLGLPFNSPIYWFCYQTRFNATLLDMNSLSHEIGVYLELICETPEKSESYIDNKPVEATPNRALSSSRMSQAELLSSLLKYSGFDHFDRTTDVSRYIPVMKRMEHSWILGSTGSGKTTLLTNFIMEDFQRVADGKASVVIIDSKRDLIKSIEKCGLFAPGQPLHGKLISIDVEDSVDYPVAMNLVDLGASSEGLSTVDKESFRNSTLSMMNYFFESLLGDGAALTSRQSTVFNFIIQLMMEIPEANLDVLLAILEPGGLSSFSKYVKKLPKDAQHYFSTQFDSDSKTRSTKIELINRIYTIKSKTTLARLFSAKKTKLSLYNELSQGKIVLVNCAKSILQDEVELFGRFMLAMVLLAAERRQLVDKKDRLNTFVYMDEAHDIISRDTRLPTLLSQARAFNVGMIIAHQDISQIVNPKVTSALMANTAMKFTGRLPSSDAKQLTTTMGFDVKKLTNPRQYSFNVHCAGIGAGSLIPADVSFDSFPKLSDEDYMAYQEENRRKYCFVPEEPVELRLVAEEGPEYEVDPLSGDDDEFI